MTMNRQRLAACTAISRDAENQRDSVNETTERIGSFSDVENHPRQKVSVLSCMA